MNKPLKEKIDNLDPWFHDLLRKEYSIHDVVEHRGETWVIWSDEKGYTVSHKGTHPEGARTQGVSGVYPDLRGCIKYIYFFD